MSEYRLSRDADGEIETCDCCSCEVPTSLFDKPMHLISEAGRKRTVSEDSLKEDQYRYCEVCSGTLISAIHSYPEQHRDDHYVLLCMAQCTNMILDEISSLKKRIRSKCR